LSVAGLFHLAGLHHDLGGRAADLILHVRLLLEWLGDMLLGNLHSS
jgi:hypothetical protein